MKPRAVFDCMVFLQGAGRPASPARACFHRIDEGLIELCLSPEILVEIKDVLARPVLRRKFPILTADWVERFIREVASKAFQIADVPRAFSYARDPKDEPYVNLAVAAGASYLVSRDKDLLDLMTDPSFRQRFPTLTILDPVVFLHEIARTYSHNPDEQE